MRLWRICRKRQATDTLSGRGGLLTTGRWHSRGRPVVYTSRSLSLAALEVLVHMDRETAPRDLVQVEIDLPDELAMARIEIRDLPRAWDTTPAPPSLQKRGDEWLASASTVALLVASAVIPEEWNVLLNPLHRDAGRIAVVSTRSFRYDSRLAP